METVAAVFAFIKKGVFITKIVVYASILLFIVLCAIALYFGDSESEEWTQEDLKWALEDGMADEDGLPVDEDIWGYIGNTDDDFNLDKGGYEQTRD